MKRMMIGLVLTGVAFLSSGPLAAADAVNHQLVGAPKCKMCHGAKTGDQWKIWSESAHAGAFDELASEASKKIAAEKGLGDPQKEAACLKCHTTQAFLGCDVTVSDSGKYEQAEGIGCESCHGAGSDYKKVMKNHEAAVAAGLSTDLGEDLCRKCHNENSPTFKSFDFAKQWAEIEHPLVKVEK